MWCVMQAQSEPDLSILVDVENVRRKGLQRALQSLTALAAEVASAGRDAEILIGSPGDSAAPWLLALLKDSGLASATSRPVRVVPAGTRNYYAAKNYLAEHASGDLLVFTDADSIVRSGWLNALLAPFDNEAVQIANGHTLVGPPANTYTRAMAACWIFDPTPRSGVTPGPLINANNVAFRRTTFHQWQFHVRANEYRGACARLAREMQRNGIILWQAGKAVALHPPLAGVGDFISWGLLSGHSWGLRRAEESEHRLWVRAGRWTVAGWRDNMRTVWARRTICDLGPYGLAAAWVLGTALWLLRFTGFCVGRVRPGALARFM